MVTMTGNYVLDRMLVTHAPAASLTLGVAMYAGRSVASRPRKVKVPHSPRPDAHFTQLPAPDLLEPPSSPWRS